MSRTLSSLVNHQVRLAARPVGMATAENWAFTEEAVAEPAPGTVLVKTLQLSLDPAMRGWLNDGRSYIPPVGIGEVMRAGGIGRVVASRDPAFAPGDVVGGLPHGLQNHLSLRRQTVTLRMQVRGKIGGWSHTGSRPIAKKSYCDQSQ